MPVGLAGHRASSSRRTAAGRRAAALAFAAIAPVVLLACGSDGGPRALQSDQGSQAGPLVTDTVGGQPSGSDPAAGDAVTIAPSLTVTDDAATAANAVITVAAGGTVSVTARDGTMFRLDVPADALAADTAIIATATDVTGIDGTTALHAVHFEPAGLQFIGAATLRITTPTPIASGHVLPFQAASDGSDAQFAVIDDLATDDVSTALLVTHFSVFGIGEIVDAISDMVVVHQTGNAQVQLQGEIGRNVEIRRNYLREGRSTAEVDSVLAGLFADYTEKVLTPLVESANATCDGALQVAHATSNYLYIWMHNSLPDGIASMKKVAESAFLTMERLCEDERIDECLVDGEHTILSTFWTNMNNWRAKFGYAKKPGDDRSQYETRARKICKGYAYFITGGLQDFQVSNVMVCDVRTQFTLESPGVATAVFSGGDSLTGSYTATGVFGLSYAGTYTITLPAGPGEAGTMIGSSAGQTGGQAGSGSETYVLSPAWQVC